MRRLVAVLSLLLMSLTVATPASAATTGFTWNDITAADGVTLKSNVIEPAAPGTHPGIVMVASWALNDLQYLAQEKRFADAGYVVLSYTARGFWFSGGTIDVAGPKDVADASSAVDWLIAHTRVDPRRIGIVGMSYGGGISLLAAAHDPRIRAVGSLSGWADLAASMNGENTRRAQAAWFLQATGRLLGRPSPETNRILDDYWADRNAAGREQWARLRSARYSIDAINRNHPAVLLAHSFGDSVFPANQMTDFYTALRTPKRLELAPGDHATVELPGLAGIPNHVWAGLRGWFDRYLRGNDTGVEPGVVLRPHSSSAVEHYPDWAHVTGHTERDYLAADSWTIHAGADTVADGGVALLTNGLEGLTDAFGFGKLFSQAPATWLSSPTTVDLPMQVTAYDLPAGHRLALVVDTKDPLYLDANAGHSTITFGAGAWLDVPLA